MTTPATVDERINRLEGAFQAFSVMVNNMVTREEMQAHLATIMAGFDSLRAEMRAEIRAAVEAERADRRESEIRNTRWIIGAIFAAATLVVAATKLIP